MEELETQRQGAPAYDNPTMHGVENSAARWGRIDGTAALSVVIGQMQAYFGDRLRPEDRHLFSFSLQQLYGRMDYLYRFALPELLQISTSAPGVERSPRDELLRRHSTWAKLRSIKQALSRVELLSNLINDAAACILDALDLTDPAQLSLEEPGARAGAPVNEQEWLRALNQNRWDLALMNLTASLCLWQEQYSRGPLLADYFARTGVDAQALAALDDVFAALLDSAAALFGEILPDFHALAAGDDEIAVTLLFDVMQQADQVLLQFDLAMEPLQALSEIFFAVQHG